MNLTIEANPIVAFLINKFGLLGAFVVSKGFSILSGFFLHKQSSNRINLKRALIILTYSYLGVVVYNLALLIFISAR